ncbi:MAG: cytochrome P450, partial [Acidimicrobiales bacterium]
MRPERVLVPVMRQVLARPRLADALFRFDPWGNPFSEESLANPLRMAEQIRGGDPVTWKRQYQQWIVIGYDEAREVLGSPSVGTANQVEVILDVSPYRKMAARTRSVLENIMLVTDPPRHTRLRGLVNRAFTPKRVAGIDERMIALADQYVAELPTDEFDLMESIAHRFPVAVIGELFGFPIEEQEWLHQRSAIVSRLFDALLGFDADQMDQAIDELYDRIVDLAAERRADPRDDLITGLALAEAEDGDRLSEEELVSVAIFILLAGHETTAAMIGNSILALHNHPDQRALIDARPELWPNAVSELLRFDTSVVADPRTALEDFELAGHRIKKGQNIAVLPWWVNRDLRHWPDADELRLDRDNPDPLSFGHGVHYCLGANLAKA